MNFHAARLKGGGSKDASAASDHHVEHDITAAVGEFFLVTSRCSAMANKFINLQQQGGLRANS
jgi:hypothetical protein